MRLWRYTPKRLISSYLQSSQYSVPRCQSCASTSALWSTYGTRLVLQNSSSPTRCVDLHRLPQCFRARPDARRSQRWDSAGTGESHAATDLRDAQISRSAELHFFRRSSSIQWRRFRGNALEPAKRWPRVKSNRSTLCAFHRNLSRELRCPNSGNCRHQLCVP